MKLLAAQLSHPHSKIQKPPSSTFVVLTQISIRSGFLLKVPKALVHSKRPRCNTKTVSEQIEIQSVKNPRVKEARALLQRQHRDKRALILLEGQRLIADALHAAVKPIELYYTHDAIERNNNIALLRESAAKAGSACFLTSEAVIRSLSDTVNPQGVVAVCMRPSVTLPPSATFILVCDKVRDPGNLGTLLRSAAASGAEGVVVTSGCADVWGLKALRAGMGAQFHVPVQTGMTWDNIGKYVRQNQLTVRVAAGVPDAELYTNVDWRIPSALIIGSEADGASSTAFANAQTTVCIPMCSFVESLNAAMAGTVILFEVQRQRQHLMIAPKAPVT